MKTDLGNATIQVLMAYYRLTSSLTDAPAVVDLALSVYGQIINLTVALEDYHADGIAKKYPLLRFPNRKVKDAFNEKLIPDLVAGLANGTIPKGYYFEQTGTNILPSGQVCFVHGSEVIGACDRPYKVAPEISSTELLGQNESPSQLLSILAASTYQVLLVFAYVLLASIRSLLIGAGINLQAVLYIVGGQGLGKTTLATRIAGIYRKGGRSAGIVQAGSTQAAVNALMVDMRDQPLIVDDLCLSASKDTIRKRTDLVSKLSRQATGDIPIIKKSGKTTVEFPCGASLILTSEFYLENPSDLTRYIIVPVKKQLNIPDELTPNLIGGAMRLYLSWFAEHCHEEIGLFRRAVDRAVMSKDMDTRMATNYACLETAFQSFLRSMDDLSMPSKLKDTLNGMMAKGLSKAVEQHQDTLNQLKDQVPVGNLSFCILEGYKNNAFNLAKKVEKLGKHDGIIWKRDLCLRPEALIRFIRQQSGYHDYSPNQITRKLKDIDALVLQEAEAATVRLSKEPTVPRVYRIRLDILSETAQKY